jgi:hypothetical protein
MPKYFTNNIPDPAWDTYLLFISERREEDCVDERSECIGVPLNIIFSSIAPKAKLGFNFHHTGEPLLIISKGLFPNFEVSDKLVLDIVIEPIRQIILNSQFQQYGFELDEILVGSGCARIINRMREGGGVNCEQHFEIHSVYLRDGLKVSCSDFTSLCSVPVPYKDESYYETPVAPEVLFHELFADRNITDRKASRELTDISRTIDAYSRFTKRLEYLQYYKEE